MLRTNLLPAVLIAGEPNCGKSVLAFMLTQRLRELGISHYLLRAAPDGEGDWFLLGQPVQVRKIRLNHKGTYSAAFIHHMQKAITNRMVPLLVDVGGKPRGEQWEIPAACTHSIVLYHAVEDLLAWRQQLAGLGLTPIAELRSSLEDPECVETLVPVLTGVIGGLQREQALRKSGEIFDLLVDRVAGICRYDEGYLEELYRRSAPGLFISEDELGDRLGVQHEGGRHVWQPAHLAGLNNLFPKRKQLAFYGRGPVWLAAALAVIARPARAFIFDTNYGWVEIPRVVQRQRAKLKLEVSACVDWDWIEIGIPGGTLEPSRELSIEPVSGSRGVILSGKLPRWCFASLARYFSRRRDWAAIYDPSRHRAVVFASRVNGPRLGDVIELATPPK